MIRIRKILVSNSFKSKSKDLFNLIKRGFNSKNKLNDRNDHNGQKDHNEHKNETDDMSKSSTSNKNTNETNKNKSNVDKFKEFVRKNDAIKLLEKRVKRIRNIKKKI